MGRFIITEYINETVITFWLISCCVSTLLLCVVVVVCQRFH